MAIQTTYAENISAAKAGMIANTEPCTVISRTSEAVAGLAFGVAVTQGTADNAARITAAADTVVLGITTRQRSLDANTPDKYGQYDSAGIMTKGVIWVNATKAVAAGDDVWVTVAGGTFNDTDAGSSASVQIANARWDSSTTTAGLAKVRMG
jgi:hypothetical protein